MSSAGPSEKRGNKSFNLGIREAAKSKPHSVEFIKRKARRSGDMSTKVRQRLGKVRGMA